MEGGEQEPQPTVNIEKADGEVLEFPKDVWDDLRKDQKNALGKVKGYNNLRRSKVGRPLVLYEDPPARPLNKGAEDNGQALQKTECIVCGDVAQPDDPRAGVCTKGCMLCPKCFRGEVEHILIRHIQLHGLDPDQDRAKCRICPDGTHSAEALKNKFMRKRKGGGATAFEELVRHAMQKNKDDAVAAAKQQVRDELLEGAAGRLVLYEQMCQLEHTCKCPGCPAYVTSDITGCMAVKCTCGGYFCGYCVDYYSRDSIQAHAHVRQCPSNPNGSLWTTPEMAFSKLTYAQLVQFAENNPEFVATLGPWYAAMMKKQQDAANPANRNN